MLQSNGCDVTAPFWFAPAGPPAVSASASPYTIDGGECWGVPRIVLESNISGVGSNAYGVSNLPHEVIEGGGVVRLGRLLAVFGMLQGCYKGC
jgi:hypothetical protein